MESVDEFAKSLEESFTVGGDGRLEELVQEFALFCFEELTDADPIHSQCLSMALKTLTDPRLQNFEGSPHLLLLFEYDWGALSALQKRRLLEVIENNYCRFTNLLAHQVMMELLGRFFCNQDSLKVLVKMAKCDCEAARSLVPLGFDTLVRESSDVLLKASALAALRELSNDPSQLVQQEVAVSFDRLRKSGAAI